MYTSVKSTSAKYTSRITRHEEHLAKFRHMDFADVYITDMYCVHPRINTEDGNN